MKPSAPAICVALLASSASAFVPAAQSASRSRAAALAATTDRRALLRDVLAVPSALVALGMPLSIAPSPANAADAASYATSIESSTQALSQSLGHAILAIDGMNAQANRLGSSPHPAHPSAVLDGMLAQARRLTRDLDGSVALLEEVKAQADEITIADERFRLVAGDVAHASSVLDGMVAQSRRLEGALSRGGSSSDGVDGQIIYVLGVLDGLNAQARRLDVAETFGVLDELNAKAAMALL